jgi:hypothetical protein
MSADWDDLPPVPTGPKPAVTLMRYVSYHRAIVCLRINKAMLAQLGWQVGKKVRVQSPPGREFVRLSPGVSLTLNRFSDSGGARVHLPLGWDRADLRSAEGQATVEGGALIVALPPWARDVPKRMTKGDGA